MKGLLMIIGVCLLASQEAASSVNGAWGAWTPYGSCTVTCGPGTKQRTRECDNPAPANGGSSCAGLPTDTRMCHLRTCLMANGAWGAWTPYGSCTVTCGTGTQRRTRVCNKPTAAYAGSWTCVGLGLRTDTRMCTPRSCPINGAWGAWTPYGSCTVTCGPGTKQRTRECDNPAPANGGSSCAGLPTDTRMCHLRTCLMANGAWGAWTPYGSCTVTCGTGTQRRTRVCNKPTAAYAGSWTCVGLGLRTDTRMCTPRSCPINGAWGAWTPYGSCTVTCGTGTQQRTRECDNPAPANGGSSCAGLPTDTRMCTPRSCPINGAWGAWTPYGSCTVTCGPGTKQRTRECDNPAPANGGSSCAGLPTDTRMCHLRTCLMANGAWGAWTPYGSCTVTCGTGTQRRTRVCNKPTAAYAGSWTCVGLGLRTDTRMCTPRSCPINGAWGAWTPYGSCTVTCGTGTQQRTRECDNPAPANGGSSCAGLPTDTRMCTPRSCPINGAWGAWTPYGSCTVTCGPGTKQRTRECDNPAPANGGSSCAGLPTDTRMCHLRTCLMANGAWGAWTPYGSCTVTCGTGTQRRTRVCNKPTAAYAGSWTCVGLGLRTDTRMCTPRSCPINGAWGAWTPYGSCTVTCGTGTQQRTRECDNPAPANGGSSCAGLPTDTRMCTPRSCPINGAWGAWTPYGSCTVTCGTGTQQRTRECDNPAPANGGSSCAGLPTDTRMCTPRSCPINGAWGAWTPYGSCTVTCGPGTKQRTRECDNPAPANGGSSCAGLPTDTRMCHLRTCLMANGAWGAWTPYGSCTVTCGTGTQRRTRVCNKPTAAYAGSWTCVGLGLRTDTRMCTPRSCPINGAWGAWTPYGSCTVTCGPGTKQRTRECDNPAPANGGSSCAGLPTDTRMCHLRTCLINGAWGAWTPYGSCTVTCGPGTQERTRECDNPAPANGGSSCAGLPTDTRMCDPRSCLMNGDWGAWTPYGSCTGTCGTATGTQRRTRVCNKPAAANVGSWTCAGLSTDTRMCTPRSCPINGAWGAWTPYGSCTVTCGPGTQERTRECDNPAPANGGSSCAGLPTDTRMCDPRSCLMNGDWGAWTPYGSCTGTCGTATGTQRRTRVCNKPAAANVGSWTCAGLSTDTRMCTPRSCPTSCVDSRSSRPVSGVVTIYPDNVTAVEVYCDQDTDGGGWAVFQRRQDGSVDFYRNWAEYQNRFGDLNGEFWIGLDALHTLTSSQPQDMRVDLTFWNMTRVSASYSGFTISDSDDNYRLNFTSFLGGTAGDSLSYDHGKQFSTRDADHDTYSGHCAQDRRGAWWYKSCGHSNLNGQYMNSSRSSVRLDGLHWHSAGSWSYSMKATEMKLRPR